MNCARWSNSRTRSGDVWVPGSRQFKDFEDYLLPKPAFESLLRSNYLPLITNGDFDRYWAERQALLRRELQRVDTLAARHELPDAEITEGGDLRRFLWDFTFLCWANPHLRKRLPSPARS